MKTLLVAILAFGVGAGATRPLMAQVAVVEAGAGVALPVGHLAARRAAGPYAEAGATLGGPARRVRLRLAADAAWLAGRTVAVSGPAGSVAYGPVRVLGAHAYALAGSRGPVRAYGLAGLGLFRASGATEHTPSVRTGVSAGAGAGVEFPVRGRLRASVEARVEGLLADYAVGGFQTPTFWPVAARLHF
ncbi:MAG: hypothetical protein ACJ79S_02910 [Gemmatimonadaceae bacterium]